MRQGITVQVSAGDRVRLAAIVADRNSQQRHVWRARIVLMTADDKIIAAVRRGYQTLDLIHSHVRLFK
jgi:hypothetical protein